MAKARNRRRKQANAVVEQYVRPTEAREAHNDFRSAGAAMRVVPVIVRLHEQGVLNDREFEALAYYRDQASLAERSPVRSCCDFSVRGGSGPGVAILSAALETGRMEREMGPLWPLCRAIAVDDVAIEAWCISRGSKPDADAVEALFPNQHKAIREKLIKGIPVACPLDVGIATLELKYAAGGIVVGRAA